MAVDLSPEAFYESARSFAETALQAHHARDYRRVALDAGTALEHLLKACLASRSPALLVELKPAKINYQSLLRLLDIPEGGPPRQVRTVSLRDALERVKAFVAPSASEDDLTTLVGMRDGTVHAALDDQVETRLLTVFAQYVNTLLADLNHEPADFWSDQASVVDALLADASDKVAHDVAVKLAAARAYFAQHYGEGPTELLELLRRRFEPDDYPDEQMATDCPACESLGLATGNHDVDWEPDEWEGGRVISVSPIVWFAPAMFECRVCHLRLETFDEVVAAGMKARWEHEGANPQKYEEPVDPDSYYEAYRDRY